MLQRLHERLDGRVDAEIFGIATRDATAAAQQTLGRLGVRFGVLSDPTGREADRLDVHAFPETMVLSPEGRIAARFRGPVTLDDLEEAVNRAR